MIIFGGYRIDQASLNEWRWTNFGDGARYNPVNDSWTVITSVGEPAPRSQHTAVWTGSEMIIWGGGIGAGTRPLLTLVAGGASYDPESDSWKELSTKGMPESRIFHTAVWTGEEMIVWGGSTDSDVTWLNTGGRYNPVNKKWRPTTFEGAPEPLLLERAETGVWTGEALFLHAPTYTYGQFSSNFTWLYYPEKPRGGPRHH
jgi:N-acetylneuraminic acid mutarotase